MQKNRKTKKERLEKLHMILDKPSGGDLHPEDEKYLQVLSKRLESSSKKSIVYTHRTSKEQGEEVDLLKPRVTIHHKEEKESVVHIKQEEPVGQKESLFEDENLYEVDKVEVKVPEFLEVKPKEVPKEEKLEREISDKKKYTKDMEPQELPEWEPVDIKKTETKIEETKEQKSKFKDESLSPIEEKYEFKEEEFFEEKPDLREKELPPTEKREKEKEDSSRDTSKAVFLTPNSLVPDVERDSKIDIFREIESIDEKTAVLLYDNGFTSIDAVNRAPLKDLIRINGVKRKLAKNIKKEIEEKLEGVASENEYRNKVKEFGEYFSIDEKIEEEKTGVFKGISSIDEKTASLLYENGIISIDILRETPINKLVKIKGVKRKLAKKIKKEIDDIAKKNERDIDYRAVEENNLVIEEDADEWISYEIPGEKVKEVKDYRYGDYTLYKKEIKTSSGKKRIVHFFSKAEPDEGVPVKLPAGFEVKVNKKTGVPYIRKKSKKK